VIYIIRLKNCQSLNQNMDYRSYKSTKKIDIYFLFEEAAKASKIESPIARPIGGGTALPI